jgi:hypothetical protein
MSTIHNTRCRQFVSLKTCRSVVKSTFLHLCFYLFSCQGGLQQFLYCPYDEWKPPGVEIRNDSSQLLLAYSMWTINSTNQTCTFRPVIPRKYTPEKMSQTWKSIISSLEYIISKVYF